MLCMLLILYKARPHYRYFKYMKSRSNIRHVGLCIYMHYNSTLKHQFMYVGYLWAFFALLIVVSHPERMLPHRLVPSFGVIKGIVSYSISRRTLFSIFPLASLGILSTNWIPPRSCLKGATRSDNVNITTYL